MKLFDFDGLMRSLSEAAAFARGEQLLDPQIDVLEQFDVTAIRAKTRLSQIDFARRIGVSPGTLRNWEQKRRMPEGPARVLLALIARNPHIVEETLADA